MRSVSDCRIGVSQALGGDKGLKSEGDKRHRETRQPGVFDARFRGAHISQRSLSGFIFFGGIYFLWLGFVFLWAVSLWRRHFCHGE
jgi:hypothetical protein